MSKARRLSSFLAAILLFTPFNLIFCELEITTSEQFVSSILKAVDKAEQESVMRAIQNRIQPEWVDALYDEAEKLRNQGEYEKSIQIFDTVYQSAKRIDYQLGMGRALNTSGFVLYRLTRYVEAKERIQQAIEIGKAIDNEKLISSCYTNLGLVYGDQGDYDLGLEYLRKSVDIREKLGEPLPIAISRINLGYLQYSLGDFSETLENFHKAIELLQPLNQPNQLSAVLNNLGGVYHDMGNYRLAQEYYQKALTIRQQIGNKPGIASTLSNIGFLFRDQGQYDIALDYIHQALKIASDIGERKNIASFMHEIGNTNKALGRNREAIGNYIQSLKIREEMSDKEGVGETLNEIGDTYLREGKKDLALDYFNKSLKTHTEIKSKKGVAFSLLNLANLYSFDRNYQKAADLSNEAAEMLRKAGLRDLVDDALTSAAFAEMKLGKFSESSHKIDEAISIVEELRLDTFGGEQEQYAFLEGRLKPYHAAALLQLEQHNYVEALLYAEKAKARTLLDVLEKGRSDVLKHMTSQEQKEEKKLNQRLIYLNEQLAVARQEHPENVTNLEQSRQKARFEMQTFRASLFLAHPEVKIHEGETTELTIADLPHLFENSQTSILEFLVTDDVVYGFVLLRNDSGDVEVHAFPLNMNRKELSDRVLKFRKNIADLNLSFRDDARTLFDLLIQPASKWIPQQNKLIIIPDSILWELPFQALVSPAGRFLVEDYCLSYAPSIAVLRETKKTQPRQETVSNVLLAFGNPKILDDTRTPGESFYVGSGGLGPLPYAEQEVEALSELYGHKQSHFYVGADAQEQRVKLESSNYRILHFATHGILDNQSPLYSYLLLATPTNSRQEDGLLEAREIMDLKLNAELVVLSACETARGKIGGEGVIGLNWALFVAGVPSMVVSQWKVDSISTSQFMLEFYKNLRRKIYQRLKL